MRNYYSAIGMLTILQKLNNMQYMPCFTKTLLWGDIQGKCLENSM